MAPSAIPDPAVKMIPTVFTDTTLPKKSSDILKLWQENVRGGFAVFPVVIDSAKGHTVTDVDGKDYIDFISQFAVVNFGYSHPKIVEAAVEQMRKSPLVNTQYVNPLYAQLADRITKYFGFDSIATMLSGSEAVESAVKIARKWAYVKKGVTADEAWILTTDRCYHGITLATMPLSNIIAQDYGQHVPKVGPFAPTSGELIQYGELDGLRRALEEDGHKIAAFIIEPIQGAAGTRVPPKGYLKSVQDLCHKHNVLFICDEVQTGYGRTGTDLAFQHEPGVKPDLVTMGKAITGGVYPMSLIMGQKHVMDVLSRNEVASTFAATPVACAAALAALEVLEEEKIAARAQRMGELLTKTLEELASPHIIEHRGRGRGLFQCLVLDESTPGVTGRRVAALCARRGVLVGNSLNRIRLSPPLTISEEDLVKGAKIIDQALRDVSALGDIPGGEFIN